MSSWCATSFRRRAGTGYAAIQKKGRALQHCYGLHNTFRWAVRASLYAGSALWWIRDLIQIRTPSRMLYKVRSSAPVGSARPTRRLDIIRITECACAGPGALGRSGRRLRTLARESYPFWAKHSYVAHGVVNLFLLPHDLPNCETLGPAPEERFTHPLSGGPPWPHPHTTRPLACDTVHGSLQTDVFLEVTIFRPISSFLATPRSSFLRCDIGDVLDYPSSPR